MIHFSQKIIHRWQPALAIIFCVYTLILLWNIFSTQAQLRSTINARQIADSQRRSVAVADYILGCRKRVTMLAARHEIEEFLANKALGMSERYGLFANLTAIEERFHREIEQELFHDAPIYQQIVYFNEKGEPLTEFLASGSPMQIPEGAQGSVQFLVNWMHHQVITSAPIFYKGNYSGMLVTYGDIAQLARLLIADIASNRDQGYQEILVSDDGYGLMAQGNPVALERAFLQHLAQLQQNILTPVVDIPGSLPIFANSLTLRTTVQGTSFSLITLIDKNRMYGEISSRIYLYCFSVFPLLLLLAAITLERQRQRAEKLQEDNTALTDEIARRTALELELKVKTEELHTSVLRAEDATKAKSLFLANMSHEIRTPMNAIIGMTHLAINAQEENKRQRFLKTVKHSAESLLGLLNDLLDFSKMEAGQFQLVNNPFNISQLLEEIVSTLNFLAIEKGLRLQASVHENCPKSFIGDSLRLRQILLNLVGNAIKFTFSGSITMRVNLESEYPIDGKSLLHFVVTDTGVGIPPENISLIFNNFEQADNSYARQYGGTGLGLSICKQLIDLMDGSIWVESQVTVGSSFHFNILLQPCAEQLVTNASARDDLEKLAVRGLHILIVDDNEVNRDMASMMLENDHKVATAANGLEALTALASSSFDVILMDVQMPVMDGLSATAIIRAMEKGDATPKGLPDNISKSLADKLKDIHVPIIAMTAHAMSEDKEMCLSAGMDLYMAKPFQYDLLTSALWSLTAPNESQNGNKMLQLPADHNCLKYAPYSQQASVEDIIISYFRIENFNDEQIARLVLASRKSIAGNLEMAEAALGEEDYPGLSMATHTLMGTLLQCGLNDLANIAGEIQLGIRSNSDLPYADLLKTLKNDLSGLLTGRTDISRENDGITSVSDKQPNSAV